MSNINIARAVNNIRSGTNVYTPLIEVVVNAIQAIEAAGRRDGLVEISVGRSGQISVDETLPDITSFTVTDNGIGFTSANRVAFDTLYTTQKIDEGGKGFGRFTCLKYFDDVRIRSIYLEHGKYKLRSFRMGRDTEIIIDEDISETSETQSGTTVNLSQIKRPFPDKGLTTVARTLVEKLLPYFVIEDRECPKIYLQEADGSDSILLNNYLNNTDESLIKEEASARGRFEREGTDGSRIFSVRIFKIYSPKNQRSKVSLVAHRREVTSTSLHVYIPEFAEEFLDRPSPFVDSRPRNFIVRVYVFSDYLDEHVSLERAGFEFQYERDLIFGIDQKDIEATAAAHARQAVAEDVQERQERKRETVEQYVREHAPWYREALARLDVSDLPHNPSEEEIESKLHHQEYKEEVRVRNEVKRLLESTEPDELRKNAADIVRRVSDSSKNELAHYVALRRSVLEIFERSLASNPDGSYSSEDVVHDIIFPRKKDSENTPFEDHNLWIVDERLNFTEYLSSDVPLDGPRSDRPDLIAYDRRIGFRGDNEATNPVIVFEFKKPQRDDFANPASREDPVQQIVRYVSKIRSGSFRTPKGREILVTESTPFFGYVICDLTRKVRNWAEIEKDFKPMPDRLGFYHWHESLNLYLEILGWDKIAKDAGMRNRIFFHKLGLE